MLKMDTRVDGSVLAVLAAYQNKLVTSKNDVVTSGPMTTPPNVDKVDFRGKSVKIKCGKTRIVNG